MSWWELWPALLCAAAISFLPGYLVVRAWSVRGLVAAGTAAPLSVGLVAVTAVIGPFMGVSWNVLLPVAAAVILALLGLLLRKLTPGAWKSQPPDLRALRTRWPLLVHLGALIIPAVILFSGLTYMIGSPEYISQTWDNVFHLNAVRYILETGSGSTLTLGGMYSNGADPALYPAAWHDLVSLVVQLTGAGIPAATNAVTLVIACLVWPVSCIFLTTRVTGTRPIPVLFAGALSAVFGSFPYLILDFGVLYPYFLSLALLPAAIALIAMLTNVGNRDHTPRWLVGVVLLGATGGIALAHPSSLMAEILLAVPILLTALVRYRKVATTTRYWTAVGLMVGYLAVGVALWRVIRPSEGASAWQPIQSMPKAIGEVLSAGFLGQGPAWVVLFLTLVAIGLLLRKELSVWVASIYLITGTLYVVASAVDVGPFRDFLTQIWYNDYWRLSAMIPMAAVVVCTVSADWLFSRAQEALGARSAALAWLRAHRRPTPAIAAVGLVAAIAVGWMGQYSAANYAIAHGTDNYWPDAQAPLLAPAERELISRIDEHVPPDAAIIANPWTGTAFAYALSGRRTLTPHLSPEIPPKKLKVMNELDEIGTDPEVCAIIDHFDSYYVLVFFGAQYMNRDVHFPGLESVKSNPDLKRIEYIPDGGALYKITGCENGMTGAARASSSE